MSRFLEDAVVLENTKLSEDLNMLCLKSENLGSGFLAPKAGQFYMLETGDLSMPLKRPISLHKYNAANGKLWFLIKTVGEGTKLIAKKKAGEQIKIQGPLGSFFGEAGGAKNIALVGGGVGLAPLYALAQSLCAKEERNIFLIAGGRNEKVLSESLLAFDGEIKKKLNIILCTDDGSKGVKGTVIDGLESLLVSAEKIYACGPNAMLMAVKKYSKKNGISAELSLEARMACGVGACVGCSLKTANGMKRVCKDGPVFKAEDILEEI